MKTQIKKWGDSTVIVLTREFMKFNNLEIGDWVDISDLKKQNQKGGKDDTKSGNN